jgi:hypothetical protein
MTKRVSSFCRTARVAQARHAKAMLLPLPRADGNATALRIHLALDLLRRGEGNLHHIHLLADVMFLVALIADLGFGAVTQAQIRAAEIAIGTCVECGHRTDEWHLDHVGFASFATMVTMYDRQLRRAPVSVLSLAYERLRHFRAQSRIEYKSRAGRSESC